MAGVFWESEGTMEFLERGATINSERYVETLQKLSEFEGFGQTGR
jgi:hypothetical protein